ncbi:DUF3995 domain-containing protein [Solicola sp. PLA-1-18]|uniref:DUF3995 domain-containing protein n=1 Tax=Solicola sp. PLA-1-18 TaxID=3380532 RepID=UPI003B765551
MTDLRQHARRAAVALGLASAALSLSWALGATWLVDTVGGPAGATSGLTASLVTLGAAGVKAAVALLPLVPHRWARPPALLAGWVLLAYGTVVALVGAGVLTGVVPSAPDADLRAIAWHTLLWDPWFALWGAALLLSLRPARGGGSADTHSPGRHLAGGWAGRR